MRQSKWRLLLPPLLHALSQEYGCNNPYASHLIIVWALSAASSWAVATGNGCTDSTDPWSWRTVTAHICNQDTNPLKLEVSHCYYMRIHKELQNFTLNQGECADLTYTSRKTNNHYDEDNAATIQVYTHPAGEDLEYLGKLTLQGIYDPVNSCADLLSKALVVTSGWHMASAFPERESPFRTCWRAFQSNYGAKVYIQSPGAFEFLNDQKSPVTTLSLKAGDKGTFYLKNRGNLNATLEALNLPGLQGFDTAACLNQKTLGGQQVCPIAYSIPLATQKGDYFLTATGESTAPIAISANLTVAVTQLGHFTFLQGNQEVVSLDLFPGAQGQVLIKNTGDLPINNVTLGISATLKNQFSGTCFSLTTPLQPAKTCELDYNIDKNTPEDDYSLSVSGTQVDNSPQILAIDIYNQAHLAFRQNGSDVSSLTLAPGDQGTFELHNTGLQDITTYNFSSISQLKVSGSCVQVSPKKGIPEKGPPKGPNLLHSQLSSRS